MFKAIIIALSLLLSVSSFAGNNNGGHSPHKKTDQQVLTDTRSPIDASTTQTENSKLVSAIVNQKRIDFIEAADLQVLKNLPDDTSGSPHQKFDVEVSKGLVVTIISNLDMCPHVPVQADDKVNVGGQFIPTGHNSGILHWTHRDPSHKRPDGYIQLGSQTYCK